MNFFFTMQFIAAFLAVMLVSGCNAVLPINDSSATYICRKTSSPQMIDGKLNEAAWQRASSIPIIYHLPGESACKASAKMLWDDKYVYVAVDVKDENIIAKHTRRDAYVWQDDCIELYFDTEPERHHSLTYFEIDVNPNNAIFDAFFINYHGREDLYKLGPCEMATCVNLGIKSAISLKGTPGKRTGWILEMAIPISELQTRGPRKIGEGAEWKANLYYHNVEDKREFMSWRPLTKDKSPHRPETFGKIYFSGDLK